MGSDMRDLLHLLPPVPSYRTSKTAKAGLRAWLCRGLEMSGCKLLVEPSTDRMPIVTVLELPVTGEGVLDLGKAEAVIARATRPLVSLMLANNETGTAFGGHNEVGLSISEVLARPLSHEAAPATP